MLGGHERRVTRVQRCVLILVFREDMLGVETTSQKEVVDAVLILVFREDMLGECQCGGVKDICVLS